MGALRKGLKVSWNKSHVGFCMYAIKWFDSILRAPVLDNKQKHSLERVFENSFN